jgi:hypothetical protein
VKSPQANFAHSIPARRWLVLVCLLLLSLSVAAQNHLHSDDLAAAAKHCPVCQVAHSSVQAAVVVQLDRVLTITGFLCSAPNPSRKSIFSLFWHFSRPPRSA